MYITYSTVDISVHFLSQLSFDFSDLRLIFSQLVFNLFLVIEGQFVRNHDALSETILKR